MATEIITTEDLKAFGVQLLQDFKSLLNDYNDTPRKKWLKSFEVMTILNITKNTLKTYRTNGVIRSYDLSQHLSGHLEWYKTLFQKVVHDLRNPIANIIGLSGMLEENLQKPENIKLLEMTKEASMHALEILSELLFIERKENEQMGVELTDLNRFFRECLDNLTGILSTKKGRTGL